MEIKSYVTSAWELLWKRISMANAMQMTKEEFYQLGQMERYLIKLCCIALTGMFQCKQMKHKNIFLVVLLVICLFVHTSSHKLNGYWKKKPESQFSSDSYLTLQGKPVVAEVWEYYR